MSIFKHNVSGKCLSFGDLGSSFNGQDVKLEDCNQFNENMNLTALPDSTIGQSYRIISKDLDDKEVCMRPTTNDYTFMTMSDQCDDDESKFQIYQDTTNYDNASMPSEFRIRLVFNGNVSNPNNMDTRQKQLYNLSHQTNPQTTKKYILSHV